MGGHSQSRRRRRRAALVVVFLAATVPAWLAAAAPAGAGLADRVRIAAIADEGAARFGRSLAVVAVAPDRYSRGCCYDNRSGQWTGPRLSSAAQATGEAATIRWSVAVDAEAPDESEAARRALLRGWELAELGVLFVPHLAGGREVGTIAAAYALARGPAGAQHEAALAVPLARGVFAVVRFALPVPQEAISAKGATVEDVPVGTWNHEQALSSLGSVRLEGNLPPARVSARTAREGRLLVGSVVDRLGHALVGQPVRLERRAGGGWRPAGAARTTATGRYALRIRAGSTYRVVAKLGATTRSSRIVRLAKPRSGG